MARDSQRSKLYASENALRWFKDATYRIGTGSVAECQALVDTIIRSDWLHREFPFTHNWCYMPIKDGRGCRNAFASGSSITLPTWARCKPVILHELAHHLVDAEYREQRRVAGPRDKSPWNNPAAHGWRFAQVQLVLIRHYLGVERHDELRDSYRKHKVRYKQPRVLSPEQRAAAAARFAAMRGVVRAAHAATTAGVVVADFAEVEARVVADLHRPIVIPDCPR